MKTVCALFTFRNLIHVPWTCLAIARLAWATSRCECDESEFCCGSACCNNEEFEEFREREKADMSEDTLFIKTGLKSALVLLILSSAIFLGCFCIMRCCKRGVRRSSHHSEGTLGEFRVSIQASHRTRPANATRGVSLRPPPIIEEDDDPPSYSEVVRSTSRFDETVSVSTPSIFVEEKPPPEYSSVVK